MRGEWGDRVSYYVVMLCAHVPRRRQIAQRYGQDVAREALHRSASDLQLKEKARSYSFTYPPSIATSESAELATVGVNALPLRGRATYAE